ncbi:unnamed protein product [Protopolystoma xenopodis]|uniref:Uncharacterized protein n=1 Tax=Protopolystoma xenopodis TaxID=117903 RepID=A0A3S5CP76_9PLAT|nr:unnamed protein product [Protopolystoma xenopodis]
MNEQKRSLFRRQSIVDPVHIGPVETLLAQTRNLGRRDCCLCPRTFCMDSGSGMLHTMFDIGVSLGRLMANHLIMTIPMDGGQVIWYDLDGNLVKSIPLAAAHFIILRSLVHYEGAPSSVVYTVLSKRFLSKNIRMDKPDKPALKDRPQKQRNVSDKEEKKTDYASVVLEDEADHESDHESDQEPEDKGLLLLEVDFFSGRMTELMELDRNWSERFFPGNLELSMKDWLVGKRGNLLSIAYIPTRELIVDNANLVNESFYFSSLRRTMTFTLDIGAFLLDVDNFRLAHLTEAFPQKMVVYNTTRLADGRVVCLARPEDDSKKALYFFGQKSNESSEPSEAIKSDGDEMERREATYDPLRRASRAKLRLTRIHFELVKEIDISNDLPNRLQAITSRPSYTDNFVVFLFHGSRRLANQLGLILNANRDRLVRLQLPFDVTSEGLTPEQKQMHTRVLR